MTLIIQKPTGAKLVFSKSYSSAFADADVQSYLTAVETADGQALEYLTAVAINDFVLGCKADGTWSAIKASCILAGARTLTGALIPLVGTAPTNNGPFVSGDYNRKTGLGQNNDATKWLDTGYSNQADTRQNDNHQSIWVTQAQASVFYLGNNFSTGGDTALSTSGSTVPASRNMHSAAVFNFTAATLQNNVLFGSTRSASGSYTVRVNNTNFTVNTASASPTAGNLGVFRLSETSSSAGSNLRIAFYGAGTSLNLDLLNARVSALITAIGAAF
jgi:hypothetical protein